MTNDILDRQEKRLLRWIGYAVLGCILLGIGMQFYVYLSCNVPRELREMTMVRYAWTFAHGKNPYALRVLDQAVPEPSNEYGFLIPLLLAPLVRLLSFLPLSTLQVCQVLTLLAEAAGLAAGYSVLRGGRSILTASLGCLYLYCCYWRFATPAGAFPDAWGLSISLGVMAWVARDEKRGKYHPCLYAAVIVALFYIKQYFVLAAPGLLVYLLFHDKKAAGKYTLCGIGLGLTSFAVVHACFPLYFAQTLAIMESMAPGNSSREYSIIQLKHILKTFFLPCLGAAMALLYGLWTALSALRAGRIKQWSAAVLARGKKIPYAAVQCAVLLIPTMYMAQNLGATYSYYLQLWCPYFAVFALSLPEKLVQTAAGRACCEKIRIARKTWLTVAVAIMCTGLALWSTREWTSLRLMTRAEKESWKRANVLLEQYSAEGEILVSAHLTGFCLESGIPAAEYGHQEFNDQYTLECFRQRWLWTTLFPVTERICQETIDYNEQVWEKVQKKEIACVAITDMTNYGLTDEKMKAAGYRLEETLTLPTGEQIWPTRFYIPA